MRRILAVTMGVSVLVNMLPSSFALTTSGYFHDTANHFSEAYVQALHDRCDINGYEDANKQPLYQFRPDASISRAELLQLVVRCAPTTTETPRNKVFSDVNADSWYSQTVTTAEARGWIDGYSDGTFRPNAAVNRAEALKIIQKSTGAAAPEDNGYTLPFHDIPVDAWYRSYVFFGYSKGYIRGRDEVTFAPGANLTRGEAAKLIALYFDLVDSSQIPTDTGTGTTTGSGASIAGCPVFPGDNAWNTDISQAPVNPNSDRYISSILASGNENLHADFGSDPDYGIPYTVVDSSTPKVPVTAEYADESDAGPYPIPANVPIEKGSDRHALIIQKDECKLYELYDAVKNNGAWEVGSAAIFDLRSNALRPDYWTSADAAGLPIFPGLVRYDEVKSGKITHALRFTVSETQRAFIHPATHFASDGTDSSLPPMGLRLRLKADFDTSRFTGDSRVILEALKTYGMIVADNGTDWYISGATDPRWNDEDLDQLKTISGSAFEAVDTGPIIK